MAGSWSASGATPGKAWHGFTSMTGSSSGTCNALVTPGNSRCKDLLVGMQSQHRGLDSAALTGTVSESSTRVTSSSHRPHAGAAVPLFPHSATSVLTSDYSEASVPEYARTGRTTSRPGSRIASASPDGHFTAVSIEDRLCRLGLSVRPAETICSFIFCRSRVAPSMP